MKNRNNERLVALLLALGFTVGGLSLLSGCTVTNGNEVSIIVEDNENLPDYIKHYKNVSKEFAQGIDFLNQTIMESGNEIKFFENQNKIVYWRSVNEDAFVISGVEKCVSSDERTITFTKIDDPNGSYQFDLNSMEVVRSSIIDDVFLVPEDAKKIEYGVSSDGKYVEIYEVNGNMYMRDKFEEEDKESYYLATKVNVIDNYEIYGVRKRIEESKDEVDYLGYQYLLVDNNKNRVIYKDNLDDSLESKDNPVSIIGISNNAITVGRQMGSDEYTDVEIFYVGPYVIRNWQNNCYIEPEEEVCEYGKYISGSGGENLFGEEFPKNVNLYLTCIPDIYMVKYPNDDFAVFYPSGDVRGALVLLLCGTQPPTVREMVDANSTKNDRWLVIDYIFMGEPTKMYYQLSIHKVYDAGLLPPDVNLVPTGKEYTPNVEPGLSARNNNNCNSNAAYSMSWGMQYDKTGNAVYGTSWDFQDETVRHKKR